MVFSLWGYALTEPMLFCNSLAETDVNKCLEEVKFVLFMHYWQSNTKVCYIDGFPIVGLRSDKTMLFYNSLAETDVNECLEEVKFAVKL